QAYRLIKQGQLADAERELDTCLTLDSRDPDIWVAYLDVLDRLKEYDRLAARFEDAGELRNDVRLRRYHARAGLERHQLEAVAADLRQLANSRPPGGDRDPEVQAIASRLIGLARADKRPEALTAILAAAPDQALAPAVVYDAANALRDLGRSGEAGSA